MTNTGNLLEGKTAVVTGGSRGIGAAIVRKFLSNGANVLLNCSSESRVLADLVQELELYAGKLEIAVGDVTDKAFVHDMVAQAQNKFGEIHILVNNAGITRDKPFSFLKDDDWDAVIATNLRGPYLCSKAVVKPMMRAKWGRVINISSISALGGRAGQTNYAASKSGLIGFSKSLARELGSYNVLVNAVCVGAVETRMTKRMPREMKEEMKSIIPVGRMGQPDEIAESCLFLASDMSSYVTGSILNVSGGAYM